MGRVNEEVSEYCVEVGVW